MPRWRPEGSIQGFMILIYAAADPFDPSVRAPLSGCRNRPRSKSPQPYAPGDRPGRRRRRHWETPPTTRRRDDLMLGLFLCEAGSPTVRVCP